MTTQEPTKTRTPRRMAREPKAQAPAEKNPSNDGAADVGDDGKAGAAASPKRTTKTDAVLALLRRAEGATLQELTDATGWQKHTVRAALTGLKKKGHSAVRAKRDGVTCYRVEGEA